MENDPIFRQLVEKVLPKPNVEVLNINNNKDCEPEFVLIENLLEIFPKVFAVLEISIKKNWKKRLEEGLKELMLKSPNSYVGGLMLLCCTENIAAVDIYDRFLNVFALVNYVTNMMFTTTGANFYELSSRVLTVFYEHVLRRDFDKRGGWKCLQKYIQDKKFVKYFHDCEKHNFVTDDFPKKLKLKIKDSFSSLSPSISRIYGREDEILSMANDLAKKVTSHVKISPLNDSNSPKLNEEQSTSKETKISNSNKANSLEVSGTMVSEESDLYARCKCEVEDLEERLQSLVGIFELLDEM